MPPHRQLLLTLGRRESSQQCSLEETVAFESVRSLWTSTVGRDMAERPGGSSSGRQKFSY